MGGRRRAARDRRFAVHAVQRRDGDDIDCDAYRTLVRYCVGDLGHEMLWLTSGVAEWWALTIDERKKLVEIAIDEARAIAPDTVIQACTAATSAKD